MDNVHFTAHNTLLCRWCNYRLPDHSTACKALADAVTPRDKTSAERKGEPVHSGVLMYFPDALAAVARVSKAGNDKHNPGETLHWARGKSTDQMDCAVRHVLTPEVIDPETGEPELAAAAWRLLAQLQLLEEKRNAARGVRSYSGIVP